MRAAFVAAFVALVALSGCVRLSDPEFVSFAAQAPKAGFAAVYVGRPGGRTVSVAPLSLELNGRPFAVLSYGTYTRIELRPGRYRLAARDNVMTRAAYGIPVPVELTVEAGKAYFALPTAWEADVNQGITVVNDIIVPARTATNYYSTFSVAKRPQAAAPSAFVPLSYVAPEASFRS